MANPIGTPIARPVSAFSDNPRFKRPLPKTPALAPAGQGMAPVGVAPAPPPSQPRMADGINARVQAAMPSAEVKYGMKPSGSPGSAGLLPAPQPAGSPKAIADVTRKQEFVKGQAQTQKFAAGMERQKQINQGVTNSLGIVADKAGNQIGRRPAGIEMPSKPEVAQPTARPPLLAAANPSTTPGYNAADVTSAAVGLNPTRATGGRLGTTESTLPSRESQAATGGRLGTMQMSGDGGGPRAEDDPEGFARFAADKTGGLEWKNDVNGPKRGRRVVGGPYNGMTADQVQAKLAEEFRGRRG